MSSAKYQRIAIIGASGQLGSELARRLGDRAIPLRHAQVEVTSEESVRSALGATHPDFVINASAYNWVDKAEDQPDVAHAVNAFGPKNLAIACEALAIPLLHMSTDYVFGQQMRSVPYAETDTPGPVNVYGFSKLAGEQAVRDHCQRHFLLRTCGLYGQAEAVGKGNFVKTMLRLGKERGHVRVVNDQHCTPTSTADLVSTLLKVIATDAYGLYHVTNAGATTWFEFASEIFRVAGLTVTLEPITTAQFGAKVHRPAYSVLDCQRVVELTGEQIPDWQCAVDRYIKSLGVHQ